MGMGLSMVAAMHLELRKSYALIKINDVIDLAWTTWYPTRPGTVDHNNTSRADPRCHIIFVTFPNSIHFVQSCHYLSFTGQPQSTLIDP